jgi:hypothetical protein
MKICTLTRNEQRIYKVNAAVLVFTDTDEAVMVDGQPRTATPEEIVALLKANKKKKLFSIEVDGRSCHFVRGREFLARTMARAFKSAVQLRAPTGRMLMNYRPKNQLQDLLNCPVTPVEEIRSVEAALLPQAPALMIMPETNLIIPEPHACPDCSQYTKPIGCREDEHHFICKFHDAYEKARAERLKSGQTIAAPPITEEPEEPPALPANTPMIIDLNSGESLRTATPEEVEEANAAAETAGFPMIERGGTQFGVATENLSSVEVSADGSNR